MRSVSAKVIVWSVAALLISLAVFLLVAQSVLGDSLIQGLDRTNIFYLHQARTAYETGGSAQLSQFLRELRQFVGGEFHLTDAQGKDLETGESREEMIRNLAAERKQYRYKRSNGQMVFGRVSGDGRYIWFDVVSPPSMAPFAPFYLLLLATVGALYWLVTVNIASPLRRLTNVVDRFGRGELGARAASNSKDEIGKLGRSFNAMAERIQTLLTAERQLLQDVSHELRSPLARLTFEAEMVRKTADRDAAAARLRHEIERLSELVGALIDMTRVEGDPSTVEMEDICVNDLLQSVADDCAVEAAAKACGLSVTPAEAVNVRANGELLRRAVENIVRNAIRYSPPGTAVEVGLRRNGGAVTIDVRDHGPGIPDELIPRVFDPFFRVDSSRDENTGGVGLGLAIARRAIRVHQGDVAVENVHPGSQFRITIPVNMGAKPVASSRRHS
jgi:signal transduction histidine kinase